jgi:hypothetical protein
MRRRCTDSDKAETTLVFAFLGTRPFGWPHWKWEEVALEDHSLLHGGLEFAVVAHREFPPF